MSAYVRKVVVQSNDTLEHVMRVIDVGGLGIALVTDGELRLVGVVTDVDIRRGLLQGKDLSDTIDGLVVKDPVVIREGAGSESVELLRLLQNEKFQRRRPAVIPVLDRDGRPRRLLGVDEILQLDRGAMPNDEARTRERVGEVLVIGGAGFIGSVVVEHLLKAGYRVKVLDLLMYSDESLKSLRDHPGLELVLGDTRHIDTVVSAMQTASCVVHLAELVGDPLCARNPVSALQINYFSTRAIAEICSYLQINRFVYASSCSVYGATADPDMLLDEDSDLSPVSLYARMKLNSELAILRLTNYNFSPCVLRLGTVFGMSPRPRFDLVVNALTAQAVYEGEVRIFGGNQWRPHVHVSDVARAVLTTLGAPLDRVARHVFNVVGENRTIRGLGELVQARLPRTRVKYEPEVRDVRNYKVSGGRIEEMLGFRPRMTVAHGIHEVALWLESNGAAACKDERYHNAQALENLADDA